jgi:anhydro-N-acetylmuramic acid kinase
MKSGKFIGMLSGTSMDALDCVLVEFDNNRPKVLDFICSAIPPPLKLKLQLLAANACSDLREMGNADIALGKCFAETALLMMAKHGLAPTAITAIGSHGQTVWHQPLSLQGGERFTLQIGDPNTIAHLTGIVTVADFRRMDMAAGGQGAPLVPAFHRAVLSSPSVPRAVLNLGGIANITVLPTDSSTPFGYDTGPASILLDWWIQKNLGKAFDDDGQWAASGNIHAPLLSSLLDEAYFELPYPKSTGRELFNPAWLENKLSNFPSLDVADVQATLMELTTQSVCCSIKKHLARGEVLVCGGGAHNGALLRRLQEQLPGFVVRTTSDYGVDPDSLEAVAFAWFASKTLAGESIDFAPFTGASKAVVAGGIYRS